MAKSFIIGIAGGTASGKTTLAAELFKLGGAQQVSLIVLDSYYRSQDHIARPDREKTNYDHPDALELDLLQKHVQALKTGDAVEIPNYDFTTHTRSNQITHVPPRPIVIVEGILALYPEELVKLFDHKIFVDSPAELRLARRLARDIRERGRTEESVLQQWKDTVQPMHMQFCEPTKSRADRIVNGEWQGMGPIKEIWDHISQLNTR